MYFLSEEDFLSLSILEVWMCLASAPWGTDMAYRPEVSFSKTSSTISSHTSQMSAGQPTALVCNVKPLSIAC